MISSDEVTAGVVGLVGITGVVGAGLPFTIYEFVSPLNICFSLKVVVSEIRFISCRI